MSVIYPLGSRCLATGVATLVAKEKKKEKEERSWGEMIKNVKSLDNWKSEWNKKEFLT